MRTYKIRLYLCKLLPGTPAYWYAAVGEISILARLQTAGGLRDQKMLHLPLALHAGVPASAHTCGRFSLGPGAASRVCGRGAAVRLSEASGCRPLGDLLE